MGSLAIAYMKDELLGVLSRVAATQLALESLRAKNTARTFGASGVGSRCERLSPWAGSLKEAAPAERERVNSTLAPDSPVLTVALIPRRSEADLGAIAHGLLVRAAGQAGQRVRRILDELE